MIRKSAFYSTMGIVMVSYMLCLSVVPFASAQESYRITGIPGFLILNSDDAIVRDGEENKVWSFGIGLSSRRMINEMPVDISADFSFSQTRIINQQSFLGNNTVDLRYQSIAISASRVLKLTDLVEISAGLNLVPQFRTLVYDHTEFDFEKDRLLSVGMGLSGKVSLVELPTNDKNIRLVMSLAGRWTNFFIHNARNRQIDGFRYNHIIVSPQLSIQF